MGKLDAKLFYEIIIRRTERARAGRTEILSDKTIGREEIRERDKKRIGHAEKENQRKCKKCREKDF